MSKECWECYWHVPPLKTGLDGWMCGNENSDCYGAVTEYNDTCEDFEAEC